MNFQQTETFNYENWEIAWIQVMNQPLKKRHLIVSLGVKTRSADRYRCNLNALKPSSNRLRAELHPLADSFPSSCITNPMIDELSISPHYNQKSILKKKTVENYTLSITLCIHVAKKLMFWRICFIHGMRDG